MVDSLVHPPARHGVRIADGCLLKLFSISLSSHYCSIIPVPRKLFLVSSVHLSCCHFSLSLHTDIKKRLIPMLPQNESVAICPLLYLLPRPMTRCHLVKAKLLHLEVCFSLALTQCICHMILITGEGKKSRQVQKSKEKAMTRQ